jgi:phosphoribosylglycinamide formyltransferase-1
MSSPTHIAILASGNGSNAEVLYLKTRQLKALLSIAAIITDNPQAGLLSRPALREAPLQVIPYIQASNLTAAVAKAQHEEKLLAALAGLGVSWVFLAGYQRILSGTFLQHFWDPSRGVNRVVNIHPSLLPQFPGKDAYQQAFNAGVLNCGVSVHYVDAGIDTGPLIAQAKFPRLPDDSFEEFRQRGIAVEHELYPRVLAQLLLT